MEWEFLVRSTVINFRIKHRKYRERKEPCSWEMNLSTGYGHFHQHGVRGVQGTKGTKVRMSVPALGLKLTRGDPWLCDCHSDKFLLDLQYSNSSLYKATGYCSMSQ